MGKKKADSFKPEILKTPDGADLVYYGVWDSCTRPEAENLSYKCEKNGKKVQIIASHAKNPRVHYVGTEQNTDRVFKILMEQDDGPLKVLEAKYFRFKPVVQRPEKTKPAASVQENREELLKYTSKRMQKMDSVRKRRAIGVGVDDAMKLKKVKVADSKIRSESDAKPAAADSADDPAKAVQKPDASRSIDDQIKDIMNQKAKTTSELFNATAIIPSSSEHLLKEYVKTASADSITSSYFKDTFRTAKSEKDKILSVYGDALVNVMKLAKGTQRFNDDPLPELQEPQVKQELIQRFADQTSSGPANARSRLRWVVTDKSRDLMTALLIAIMYQLAGKKYISMSAVTKLLSTSAKKVTRVAALMNCRVDKSSAGQDIAFSLPKKSDGKTKEKSKRAGGAKGMAK